MYFCKLSSMHLLHTSILSPGRRRAPRRGGFKLDALLVGVAVLLLPATCFAWGPAAHMDFGLRVLEGALLLPPLLRRLLASHPLDFLYGNLAADMVVGKNMAPRQHHCHSWDVALRLLDQAHSDHQRALGWGFLSHLAADVVAHNYFVPVKTVESFATRTTGHAYWELRFDQLAHGGAGVWPALREVGRQRFGHHDRFLQANLRGSSRLMPFSTSRRLFSGWMRVSRLERWRRTSAAVARRSAWQLAQPEVNEVHHLCMAAVISTLVHAERSNAMLADPTGERNLYAARLLRRQLKRLGRRQHLEAAGWPLYHDQLRRGFREGISAPLRLPPVSQICLQGVRTAC